MKKKKEFSQAAVSHLLRNAGVDCESTIPWSRDEEFYVWEAEI